MERQGDLRTESLMTVVIQASNPGRNPMSPPYSVRSKLKLGISTKATYTRARYGFDLFGKLLTVT